MDHKETKETRVYKAFKGCKVFKGCREFRVFRETRVCKVFKGCRAFKVFREFRVCNLGCKDFRDVRDNNLESKDSKDIKDIKGQLDSRVIPWVHRGGRDLLVIRGIRGSEELTGCLVVLKGSSDVREL